MIIDKAIADLESASSMATVLQDSMETGHLDASLYAPSLAILGEKIENALKVLKKLDPTAIRI